MRIVLVLLCLGLAGGTATVDLEADLGHVSLRQVEIIRHLIRAAAVMDELYQQQLSSGGFYPADMDRAEFEAWNGAGAASPVTRIMRDSFGGLEAVPYHEAWPRELGRAARLLARAGEITTDEALRRYLTLRARALITGDHARADDAWTATRNSDVDVLIGPIGVDADREFGLKAGFGAFVLSRDWAWGARLAHYMVFLPMVQRSLPVSEPFKAEVPDVDVKLAVYDLLYQAGAGADSDERVRLRQGTRRLQLRNVMRARFDALAVPAAATLIEPEQRAAVNFEAFFLNTMFHEMAHSLGLRRTIDGRAQVSVALREHGETIEELKAAVLSLWLIDWLHAQGELTETTPLQHHASLLASLCRDIHLDAYSAAGQARLILFNYFRDWGAFRRDAASGQYRVDATEMRGAIEALAAHVLTVQGGGDYVGAAVLINTMGIAREELRADRERLAEAGVPEAVEFRQGEQLLGL
jgi:hypothetical protein